MGYNISEKLTKEENIIRMAIVDFIIDNKRPFNINGGDYLSLDVDFSRTELKEKIAQISKKDGFVLDENGDICFSYPVSAYETHHKVRLEDGRSFFAMCAIDAIGAHFTFEQKVKINSLCSYCNDEIILEVSDACIKKCNKDDLHILTFKLGELENWAASC